MRALLIASSAACILLPAALVPSSATREGAGPHPVHAEHVGVEPAGRLTSTAAQRDAVSITVYNQNFGLVREIRTIDLAQGVFALEYADVASAVQPETVHIRPLTGGALQVLEQNYQYDLLSPQKLLEKYVGRTVRVYRTHPVTGAEEAVDAEVLSVNGGPILRIGDEITFNYPGRFGFPEVPDNLIAEPTLLWRLGAEGGRQQVEVTYLTRELNWKADYVMVVNADDDAGDLAGWVTLTNQSGTGFEGARLQLVAGDVRRVSGGDRAELERRMMADAMAAQEAGFSEEAFFEYHLYTLGRPADVLDKEQKQVSLLEASDFGIEKRFIVQGSPYYYRSQHGRIATNRKVGVFLDFENSEANGLGMPLPRGTVRVYKRDPTGAQQFIGEDLIDHTPRDEILRIKVGEAFDVVADRIQTDFDVISSCVTESAWQIDLRNHKDDDIEIEILEPLGGDWDLVSASHAHSREDAWTLGFRPEVEADGETRVEYRVRVRWC